MPFLIIPNYATNSQVVRKSVKHGKIELNQYRAEGKFAILNYSQLFPNYHKDKKSVKHDKIKLNQYRAEGKFAVLNYSQLCHKLSQSC